MADRTEGEADPADRGDDTLPPSPVPVVGAPSTDDISGAAPDDTPWLPERFDAIGPPLGTGATAVVWPVRYRLDGREFALKVWRRPLAGDTDRERFRREVRQYVALNEVSGHIVTYSWADEGSPGGLPWIGMERHGQSLQQVAERGRPQFADGLMFCADLLAGLAAHRRDRRGALGQGLTEAQLRARTHLAPAELPDLWATVASRGLTSKSWVHDTG